MSVKRGIKRVMVVFLAVALAAAAWFAWQIVHRSGPVPGMEQVLPPAKPGAMSASFLGVSTLLFDDGETAILIDGFFTRPGKLTVLAGKVAPDPERIAAAIKRAGIGRLTAVIVVHSHYDHAMDAPEVARRTGALVVGSESTANVARGWGMAEDRIRIVQGGDTLQLGRFRITLIESRHAPTGFTGGEILEPLVPPVRASRYHEGTSYSLLIERDGKSALVQGSAGFIEGALRGRKADVAFLGIGLLGKQDDAFRQAYWHETVAAVGARRVIPIHWDDFTLPLDRPLEPLPWPLDDVEVSMRFILERARQSDVEVKFAPLWARVDPFAQP